MNAAGIGAELRGTRLKKGLSLEAISNKTKITPRFLEAIEEGRIEALPGIVFARNFVRQYALALDLDPTYFLAQLPVLSEEALQLPDPSAQPRRRAKHWDMRNNSLLSSAVWLLLAIGAGLAAWAHYNHQGWNVALPRIVSARASSTASSSPSQVSALRVWSATEQRTSVQATPAAATNVVTIDSHNPSAAPVARVTEGGRPVQVAVTAVQPAWVQIVADGQTTYAGMLQASETKEISAAQKVKIVAGKQGGLNVSLNGKKLNPLAPSDQIRVVTLTAEGLVLQAPAPAPVPPQYDPL